MKKYLKYDISVTHVEPPSHHEGYFWSVNDDAGVRRCGWHCFPGQARHDAMEARRTLDDNPPLQQVFYDLMHMEDIVACELVDAMDAADEAHINTGMRFDDYVEQDDGTKVGVLYAEHSAPELDDFRSRIIALYEELEEFIHDNSKEKPRYDNGLADIDKYEKRVQELEADGCTRSDAQGIADAELEKEKTE